MTDVDAAVLVEVREMRSDMDRGFRELKGQIRDRDARIMAFDLRIGAVEKLAAGESIVGRYAAADVESRLAVLEARLAALEQRA